MNLLIRCEPLVDVEHHIYLDGIEIYQALFVMRPEFEDLFIQDRRSQGQIQAFELAFRREDC